jgi:hypothetical protein
MLVKNLQSKYRDLSVLWFMNKTNMEAVEAFISTHRFYTVVYAIEWEQEQVQEKPKHQENLVEECTKKQVRDTLPCSYASVLKGPPPPTTAHALLAPALVTVMEVQETIKRLEKAVEEDSGSKTTHCDSWSDSGSHGTLSSYESHETVPTSYRGGSYNKTEFENVREYYQKWGRDRLFVMFGTRSEVFGRYDKQAIRNLLNNVLRDPKYQELIRKHDYYYLKVVRNFHYDASRAPSSYHFNVVFKNELNASGVYHIYVDQERTKVIRVSALFNDVRG